LRPSFLRFRLQQLHLQQFLIPERAFVEVTQWAHLPVPATADVRESDSAIIRHFILSVIGQTLTERQVIGALPTK
jgi:hypothetical protein